MLFVLQREYRSWFGGLISLHALKGLPGGLISESPSTGILGASSAPASKNTSRRTLPGFPLLSYLPVIRGDKCSHFTFILRLRTCVGVNLL